ncbi:cdc42 effector protein 1 [Eucyclogobius newberryi]|uniref:cdc42 effector protein 1 n=1 Tax=Eucyclogobius newberryi TaxID=166745 RepID=UPI003B5BA23C
MNLQEKLSGLKGLVTHSHSKRRFKGDLSTDMISPPLGDFRHTMHVGRGGDVFGDTSFLSNHGGTANGNSSETDSISSPDNKIGAFFSRTLRHIRRGSDNRAREAEKELSLSPPAPVVSPIIKNAISLPRLDADQPNGSPTRVLFPSSQNSPEDEKTSYGVDSGFVTLPRLSRSERQQPSISLPASRSPDLHRGSLTDPGEALLSTRSSTFLSSEPKYTAYSDSLPSLTSLDFTFDLGPSLMSEVLGLIDGGGHVEDHVGHAWEEGSACGLTNEGSEMDSATISYVDSLLREDCGGKSPHWEDEEAVEVSERAFSVKMPDVVMGSAERVKGGVGMESERFQSATDVLARHYGGSGSMKGHNKMDAHSDMFSKKKTSYTYIDDEDEIKV